MRKRILILADDLYNWGSTFEFILESEYNTVRASDLDKALELLGAGDIDLLVMSSRMIKSTQDITTEITRKISNLHPHLPIIVVLECEHHGEHNEFLSAGATVVIEEFEKDNRLKDVVSRVLNKRKNKPLN